jgi:dihydrofolate reductase
MKSAENSAAIRNASDADGLNKFEGCAPLILRGEGEKLITFGGARFAAALLRAGLVDELQLFVNPAILGSGLSLFEGIADLKPELISSRGYACGITVLRYRL